ncbi:TPA: NADPH-dependent FMN reductase [Vibrio cholerae]|nr:NAD(P)H-dependent oxidoreductase [Vibrio cholerae]
MKLCIVSGSHRDGSQSAKLAAEIERSRYVADKFKSVEVLDLYQLSLPLWNEGVWSKTPEWEKWEVVASTVSQADAFIFITPEWGGMVPPGLKNFLLLCGLEEVGHKPALIVSISASKGGTNPVHELRATAYKNNHICFIPDHVILRHIDREAKMLIDDTNDDIFDYHISLLSHYSKALQGVRASGVVCSERFRYGMS